MNVSDESKVPADSEALADRKAFEKWNNERPSVSSSYDDGLSAWQAALKYESEELARLRAENELFRGLLNPWRIVFEQGDEADKKLATFGWCQRVHEALTASPASNPGGKQESVAWLPMGSAPKNGTLIRLLVEPEDTHHTSFTDGDAPYSTIGFNLLEQTSIDAWEFAGWDWKQEVFITGSGTPIGWLPMSAQPAVRPVNPFPNRPWAEHERRILSADDPAASAENASSIDAQEPFGYLSYTPEFAVHNGARVPIIPRYEFAHKNSGNFGRITEADKAAGVRELAVYLDPHARRVESVRLRGALINAERQLVAVYGEPKEGSLDNKRGVDCILSIRAALAASPAPFSQEQAEEHDIGRRDGYEEAVQRIDMLTGGDGEYRFCMDLDPDRHTPDADTMIKRIADRFVAGSAEVAQARETMEDVLTHKEGWRNALQENCDNADDQDDAAYWRHEIAVLDRVCSNIAESPAKAAMLVDLRAENARLLDENHALKTASWPDWAEKTLKVLRTHSGADGTDDWEGVDLPGELEEHLSLLDDEIATSEVERLAHVASNERLRKAVEPFALASTEGVIKKASGHETVVTCAEYFHEAAAALAASPAPHESREQLAKRLIAEVVAEAGAKGEHDFGFQATLIAEAVLLNLGIGTDPSREVGADPRRDRISALIDKMLPYREIEARDA